MIKGTLQRHLLRIFFDMRSRNLLHCVYIIIASIARTVYTKMSMQCQLYALLHIRVSIGSITDENSRYRDILLTEL